MLDASQCYLRDPRLSLVSRGTTSRASRAAHGSRQAVASYDDARVAALLPYVTVPIAGAELEARLASRPDLRALVPKLVHDGVLLEGSREALLELCRLSGPAPARKIGTMVLAIGGGIYASLLMPFLYQLPATLCERLEVVVTAGAREFINPGVFDYLGHMGIRVFEGTYDAKDGVCVPHVELARAAELVVVFPATAHCLQRLASGACSDLLALVVAATRAPVVLLPVMNVLMWTSPAVARNVELLRGDGHYIVEPGLVSAISKRELDLMYGGPGVRWDRPEELIALLSDILETHGQGAGRGR